MDDRYLRTGVFLASFHALRENPTLAIERDMELVAHLDRLNYHEAWIGEHHSGGFEIIACPEMFIAAAARETRYIRLGTGVVSLPYHHPFTLASRIMQLDHMTRGRAMFGVGPGSLIYDAEKIGLKAADQRRRMDESLDCLMQLLQDEMITRQSGTSDEALAAHARHWAIHEEAARETGKSTDRSRWRIVTFAHIAETREKARADMAFGLADFNRYFNEVATFPIVPPGIEDPLDYLTERGLACIGTPDDCIRPSSAFGRARTAASAPCSCSRTTGPIGRRPSAATSSWPATFIPTSSVAPTACANGATRTRPASAPAPAWRTRRRFRPRSTNTRPAKAGKKPPAIAVSDQACPRFLQDLQ